jgi:hypothetical protein
MLEYQGYDAPSSKLRGIWPALLLYRRPLATK